MMEFIYCPNPTSDEPVILINGSIGEGAITGEQVSREIYSLCEAGKSTINILINSSGGEVFHGYAIHSTILECKKQYNCKIDTINGGIAASIAGCFFQAGSRRIMYDYSKLMIHNPFSSDGSIDKGLLAIRESLITLISKRSGLSEKRVDELMSEESWITAEDCLRMGLCDEVRSSDKLKDSKDVLNRYVYLNCYTDKNKKINKKMNKDLLKILNDAGVKMDETASDDDIVNAIDNAVNHCNDDDSKKMDHFPGEPSMPGVVKNDDDMDEKINDLIKKYDDLKKAYDAVLNDNISMKKIIKSKEEKEYNDAVEKTIEMGIKNGKINNSTLETCKLMAKADLNLFNKWLDAAPVNKTAPKIEARDFVNEDEKIKNEAEIEKATSKIINSSAHDNSGSFLMNVTSNLINKMNENYNK